MLLIDLFLDRAIVCSYYRSMAAGQHDVFMFILLAYKFVGCLDSFAVRVNFMNFIFYFCRKVLLEFLQG